LSWERKERKNTNNQSSVAIQPWFVYTHRIMWKSARLHIYLDNVWPDLAAGRRLTCLLNGTGIAHLLARMTYTLTTFQIKNKKDNMKNIKTPHDSLNYTTMRIGRDSKISTSFIFYNYNMIIILWTNISKRIKNIFSFTEIVLLPWFTCSFLFPLLFPSIILSLSLSLKGVGKHCSFPTSFIFIHLYIIIILLLLYYNYNYKLLIFFRSFSFFYAFMAFTFFFVLFFNEFFLFNLVCQS